MTTRIGVAACLSAIVLCAVAQPSTGSAGTEKVKKRKGMEMPSQLATGSLEMKVTNRKHFMLPGQTVPLLLEFGSFQVVDFERGWIRTSGNGVDTTHTHGCLWRRYAGLPLPVGVDGNSRRAAVELWVCRCGFGEHSETVDRTL